MIFLDCLCQYSLNKGLTRLGFESRVPNPESGILVRIWIFSGFYFFTNTQVSEFRLRGWRSKGKVKRIWARNRFAETPNPLSLPFWTPATQASASLNARIFLTLLFKYATYHSPHGWHLVYGSHCSGNQSRHSKQVDTGISHLIQQKLLLDNVLKKRNTTEKNVRGFSKISYAGPRTTVNSAF